MLLVSHLRAAAVAAAFACTFAAFAQTAPAAKPAQKKAASKPQAAAAADAGYRVEPEPAWVVPAKERASTPVASAPMHYRVIDEQLRVEPKSVSEYTHVVRVVNDANGLATASQIQLEFDPSYQTLVLHRLEVVRDGKHSNRLDRKRLQLLHRETQLERQMVDGRMTLSIVLEDVRTGDMVDFAYTLRGENPVFDYKFVHTAWLGSDKGPVALYQVRLLAPAERPIQYRTPGSDVQVESRLAGPLRETVFRRESAPQLRTEPNAPFSAVLPQLLQFSEFADWAEVARWGQSLFSPAGGALLDAQAQQIRAAHADRAERVLAALELVQKDVRYFGTEIGPNTHRPTAPDKVLEQRFGDCKDKVQLLVALLRRLDVEAVPVLVSTTLRGQLDRMLPSPLAFDHVIARVDLEGGPLWLDATRTHQSGPLAKRQARAFGKGLPLSAGTDAPAALPTPYDSERVLVQDTLRIERFADDPVLESRITYRGDMAEIFREVVAQRGLQPLGNDFSAAYLRLYPKLKPTADLQMEAVPDDDAVAFVQRFSVPGFWRFPQEKLLVGDIVYWGLIEALALPKAAARHDAFAFGFPGVYRHRVSVQFAEDVFSAPASQRFEDGDAHVKVSSSVQGTKRSLDYSGELRIVADQVEAAEWQDFTAKVNQLMPRLGGLVAVPAIPLAGVDGLNRELSATEAGLRAKRLRATTKTQAQARFRDVVLSAQLAGDRLNPALQAQAYTARGVERDHLGLLEPAADDFERAIELAPEAPEGLNGGAINALMRKQYDRAIELADRVLKKDPHNTEALDTRALARYFKQDLAAARSDLEQLLQDPGSVRRGYPLLWLSFAMRQSGQDPLALESRFPADQLPSDWPRPLVDLALGKASADAVIKAAKATKNPQESLCEAYFYLGEKYHAEGDTAKASKYWRQAVDQGVVEFIEDGAARIRLAGMGLKP